MSVIAWDGKTLCADKQCTWNGTPTRVEKIFKKDNIIAGSVGIYYDCIQFKEWLGTDNPKPTLEEDFSAISVENGILKRYGHKLIPIIMNVPFWSIGCGCDFAMGAMASGKNSYDAVSIACKLDIHCGMGIDSLTY